MRPVNGWSLTAGVKVTWNSSGCGSARAAGVRTMTARPTRLRRLMDGPGDREWVDRRSGAAERMTTGYGFAAPADKRGSVSYTSRRVAGGRSPPTMKRDETTKCDESPGAGGGER